MGESLHIEADEKTLKKVIDLAVATGHDAVRLNGGLTPAFEHYLEQVVRFATGEDRNWQEPETLLERALSAWRASETRAPGEHIISLRMQETRGWRAKRLVLDIVTDDMAFLVDSISGALTDAGKPVSFFLNAVVDTARDANGRRVAPGEGPMLRESMIHAEMDPAVDDSEIDALHESLSRVLHDVSVAVNDWEPMRARLGACIAQLERARPSGLERDDHREAVEFLKWLWDNRFAFLGARHYHYRNDDGQLTFEHDADADLGILRDPSRRVLKSTYSEKGHLSPAVEDFMKSDEPILVAKANAKSLVHRRVYMDYIGVKSFALNGEVTGEQRFVGLFTADAYNRPASDIPLVRAKVRKVVERAEFAPGSHNEKALINILETYPRDEMFQVDVNSLAETSRGVLRLFKRPRVKLFIRRDRFDRFVSALVYVPRDRFRSDVREAIGRYLAKTYNGRVSAFYPSFGDATLVRVHYIIGIDRGAPEGPSLAEMTRSVRAICREWRDDLLEAMRSSAEAPPSLYARYENAFDAGYRDRTSPTEALADIAAMESMVGEKLHVRVYRQATDGPTQLRLKLYCATGPLRLSNLIPILENLGLDVVQEDGFDVAPDDGEPAPAISINDFLTELKSGGEIDLERIKTHLEQTLVAVLSDACEDDPFNALVVSAGLSWREAWALRAAARHHGQAGFQFSQNYMAETLARHPEIARDLVAVFHARFAPDGPADRAAREQNVAAAEELVLSAVENVSSLDEDRIIRRYLDLFAAITRTNYYQTDKAGAPKPYVSFKIDSQRITELPEPKPHREIFVSSPRVDGVHLRFGPVARGGLRWSDRREDYRTEVLGLVKAQRVKNAVIVPAGSKGCFYPKQLPAGGDRAAIYEEGREAYKVFIRGLLDLTDNIVDDAISPPRDLYAWDEEDPYLVVAADKGTAQFSDTANEISAEYGFWLDDAFASGGSAGYDHKAMGITARGAWEAVKRHFREIGKDIQTEPFTVAGVGDMSGDVFGNGMLLSEQIKLTAAFDHRDIFIDPDPDPAASFAERKRLFEAPRSSWQDYNEALLSKGGGVFSRQSKSIELTPEIKALLDLDQARATPNQLIQAILKSRTELFWLGGIGTYFKAASEENWQVGDRGNDAVRINSEDMRFKVVGEGANLGLTQEARIVFARQGGRINTDAIDNSAGVDSSDHEVNIKILVASAIAQEGLASEERNALLAAMTEDVAEHVLVHNYTQTRSLSQREKRASSDLDSHARLMTLLERDGRLDRDLEGLPSAEEIAALSAKGQGLSRPEISVLLAYAKNWLFEELVNSKAPDDAALEDELYAYFPESLRKYEKSLTSHRLRREIIATRLANEVIETCGPSFPFRAANAAGVSIADVALAYEAARRVLDVGGFADRVDALDNRIDASVQIDLYNAASDALREQMYRIASGAKTSVTLETQGVSGVVSAYQDAVARLKTDLPAILPTRAATRLAEREAGWRERGAPEEIARDAAILPATDLVFDIVNLADETGWPVDKAAAIFLYIGDMLQIDQARLTARDMPRTDYYENIAIRRLTEDLGNRQSALALHLVAHAGGAPDGAPEDWRETLFADWRGRDETGFSRYERFLTELEISAGMTVAKLSLLNRKLFDLEERLKTQ